MAALLKKRALAEYGQNFQVFTLLILLYQQNVSYYLFKCISKNYYYLFVGASS